MACGEQGNGRRVHRNTREKWVGVGGGGGGAQIYVTKIGMDANTIAGAIGGNTIGLELREKIG